MAELSIYKYVRTDRGWPHCKAAFHPICKVEPNLVPSGAEGKAHRGKTFLELQQFALEWSGKDGSTRIVF